MDWRAGIHRSLATKLAKEQKFGNDERAKRTCQLWNLSKLAISFTTVQFSPSIDNFIFYWIQTVKQSREPQDLAPKSDIASKLQCPYMGRRSSIFSPIRLLLPFRSFRINNKFRFAFEIRPVQCINVVLLVNSRTTSIGKFSYCLHIKSKDSEL